MNREEYLREALKDISSENIPEYTNLWPRIFDEVEYRSLSASHPKFKLSSRAVIIFLILAILAACGYASYRIMMDPGLQAVEEAGMVTDLDMTAGPTVFAEPPWPPRSFDGIAQTLKGITVTLNWAYADESRMAMQLTLSGLNVPQGVYLEDIICRPYITSDEDVSLTLYDGDANILEDRPGKPIELTYVYHLQMDTRQYDYLNFDLDLTIGPCSDYLNFLEVDVDQPLPTPIPLIGNYHLKFRVPVYKAITITPDQTVTANGLSIRLESITISPSYSELRLCYHPPNTVGFPEATDWMPEATIRIGESEPAPYAYFSDNIGAINQSEYCADLGFEVAYDGHPTAIKITVERLSTWPYVLTPDLEESAKRKLIAQDITVEFRKDVYGTDWKVIGNDVYGIDWKVVSKPENMTDAVAYQKVVEALTETFEGPWVFTVDIKP